MTNLPAPHAHVMTLADDIVIHALDVGRAGFRRCFARAQKADPTLDAMKVNLHVLVDAAGAVLTVDTDVTDAAFAACLVNVAKRLPFPAPGQTAMANIAFVAS